MPVLNRRWNHQKVYRPNGMKYAEGRDPDLPRAIAKACLEFEREFHFRPRQEDSYFEIIGVTADWVVVFMEIKD